MSFIFSISGLRGIVGKDLNPDIIYRYAKSFGRYLKKGRVVIGRDTRGSGKLFRRAVVKGLNSSGRAVVDLGIVPTPTVLFMVRKLKAAGGIVITASHNPAQWNALKFASSKGLFLSAAEFKAFSKKIVIESGSSARRERVEVLKSGLEEHIEKIVTTLKPLQTSFRVAVDAVNGAGSMGLPMVLEAMGCKVYRLSCSFAPDFPRKPEPVRENIAALCRFVESCKLDAGFACDPDCDRLSVVDENGNAIGEEKSLVLATDYVLSEKQRKKPRVVTNLSTTALMDHVAQAHGALLYRTKVGEANVVSRMKTVRAVIGGEGNGGVIYPRINFTRDAMAGAAMVVKLMAKQDEPLSKTLSTYPRYFMIKRKLMITREQFEEKKEMLIDALRGKLDLTDGLKIVGRNYWLHIRPSQTEHLVRVIGESRDRALIENQVTKVKRILYR
jgi:phosphomannomutase